MIGTCLVPVRSGSNDAIPSARLAVSGPRTLKENPVLPDHERHDAAVPILRRDSNECEAAAHPTLLRPVTRATFGPLPFRSQDTRVVAVERHGLFLRAAMAFGRRPGSEFAGRARTLGLPGLPMEPTLLAGCAGELPVVCANSPASFAFFAWSCCAWTNVLQSPIVFNSFLPIRGNTPLQSRPPLRTASLRHL